MALSISLADNGILVEISGEIDHHSAKALREEIDKACEKYAPNVLYIDLSSVTFMDSSGIGLMLGRLNNMKSRGKTAVGIVPEGRIRKILTMAAVDRYMKLYVRREDIV